MNARRTLILGATVGLLDLLGLNKKASAQTARLTNATNLVPQRSGGWPQGAAAQLIAGNVITPLRHVAYSADWFFGKLLALGPEDTPPNPFRATIVNTSGTVPLVGYVEGYISDLAESYSLPVSYFDQTVEGYHMFLWNGVKMKGLQVVTSLPESLTPEEVQKLWDYAYLSYGNVSKPTLTSAPGLSGWSGLATAWSLIATPEAKAVWLTSSDAPSRPKYKQPNESGVQLIVGHPGYESGRKPPPFEQSMERLNALLKSIRLRPTKPPMPELTNLPAR